MGVSKNKRFHFEVFSSSCLAHLHMCKEDNIFQSMWDKNDVLLGTFWQTCEETWELFALTPFLAQPRPQDKKGRPLQSMT